MRIPAKKNWLTAVYGIVDNNSPELVGVGYMDPFASFHTIIRQICLRRCRIATFPHQDAC